MPTKKPCKECGRRPKAGALQRCVVCWTRHQPVDVQVRAAERRLGMIPVELRVKRVPEKLWPPMQRWCASCQSFVDLEDVPKGGARCRACTSAASHSARIEKVYGLDKAGYDALLDLQGGKCAICRARPKSKRLAVDHDHATGAVRGLLCSRCNHDLLGAGWDSIAVLSAAVSYLQLPPAGGDWSAPETKTVAPAPARAPRADLSGPGGLPLLPIPDAGDGDSALGEACTRIHYLPAGSVRSPDGRHWRVLADGSTPPF